jgi:glycosyltransferase involved in cell wall biosynthesis
MSPSQQPRRWAIVIPFYNEERFIAPTIACARALDWPDLQIILVDNASTDGSHALVAGLIADEPRARLVVETAQGHTFALRRGFALAGELGASRIAFWDADTIYPPDYVSRADALIGDDPHIVGAQAIDIYGPATSLKARWQRWRLALTSRILWDQGHTGTYGQAFRMDALAACGGPKNDAWPFVLYDHELVHRIISQGRLRMHKDHVCWPSSRRVANSHVRWNLTERLIYALTPFAAKDWFFYRFLNRRLAARGMWEAGLRVRDWEQ